MIVQHSKNTGFIGDAFIELEYCRHIRDFCPEHLKVDHYVSDWYRAIWYNGDKSITEHLSYRRYCELMGILNGEIENV